MFEEVQTTILTAQSESDLGRLVELAEFWKIPYRKATAMGTNDIIFSSGITEKNTYASKDIPAIISPRGFEDAQKIAGRHNLRVKQATDRLALPVSSSETVRLETSAYRYEGADIEPILSTNSNQILVRVRGTTKYLLCLDILGQYEEFLYGGIDDFPSRFFKTLSKIPIPYSIIPGKVRNWSLRRSLKDSGITVEPASVEFLRILFLASLASICNKPIPRLRFWKPGKSYALVVTHDVETKEGLHRGTSQLLEIERSLEVNSTWNIPSDRYKLSPEILHDISKFGNIGAHDTKHDGRLILSPLSEKIRRAKQAKQKLERLSGKKVRGFRAPLLQHSGELLDAVGKAGYEYDSSVPTLEMLSPTSMTSHGVRTVFPFQYAGIWEVPVSLPQDHQLIKIFGLSPKEAGKKIFSEATHVKALGGVCTLLIHPDYDYGLPENGDDYKKILEHFTNDASCQVTTMENLVDWWKKRMDSTIDPSTAQVIHPRNHSTSQDQLANMELVHGFGPTGFKVEAKY